MQYAYWIILSIWYAVMHKISTNPLSSVLKRNNKNAFINILHTFYSINTEQLLYETKSLAIGKWIHI